MAPDTMRVQLRLCLIGVLAVLVDTVDRLEIEHRNVAALSAFFIEQGPSWCRDVRVVVSDGSKSYKTAIDTHLGGVRHVLDRFHVVPKAVTAPPDPSNATSPHPSSMSKPSPTNTTPTAAPHPDDKNSISTKRVGLPLTGVGQLASRSTLWASSTGWSVPGAGSGGSGSARMAWATSRTLQSWREAESTAQVRSSSPDVVDSLTPLL